MTRSIIITIRYCSQCKWLLRASWMAQELLQTFNTYITSINLMPDINGVYQIFVNDIKIWDKKSNGGFPEPSIIKTKLRNLYLPNNHFNHVKHDIKQ